jgi:hypothetical protein
MSDPPPYPANTAEGSQALSQITSGTQCTAFGAAAMQDATTCFGSTAVGAYAGMNMTVGQSNTCVGANSMLKMTGGTGNCALGSGSLCLSTTSNNCIAIGRNALYAAAGTQECIAIGTDALANLTSGSGDIDTRGSVAIGFQAATLATTASEITAVGYKSLADLTTGKGNTAMGHRALENTSSGEQNTAVGAYALLAVTAGYQNIGVGVGAADTITSGSSNVSVGTYSMYTVDPAAYQNVALGSNTMNHAGCTQTNPPITVSGNVAAGANALDNSQNAVDNVAIGLNAMCGSSGYPVYPANSVAIGAGAMTQGSGWNNVAIGAGSGGSVLGSDTYYPLSGDNPTSKPSWITVVGSNACIDFTNGVPGTNCTYIGAGAQPLGGPSSAPVNNQLVLGNPNVSTIYCATTLTTPSDMRDKSNVDPISPVEAGAFLDLVEPVRFVWEQRPSVGTKRDIPDTGFLAQNLVEAQSKSGCNLPRLVDEGDPEHLRVCYTNMLPPLVSVVRSMRQEMIELKDELRELRRKLA